MPKRMPGLVSRANQKSLWAVVVVAIALVAAVAGSGYWYLSTTVPVPDVVGGTAEQAEAALVDVGLALGDVAYAPESDAVPGTVVAQGPRAGQRVKTGSSVLVTVAGAEMRQMPMVEGLTEDEAQSSLAAAGFVVAVEEVESTKVAKGRVVSQSIVAGTLTEVGTETTLQLSVGARVPSVTGLTQLEAKAKIEAAGLAAIVQQVESSTVAKGRVISQSIVADTLADVGTEVTLQVSIGAPLVRVPSVTGLFGPDAGNKIEASGLVPKFVFRHGPPDEYPTIGIYQIYKQEPGSGVMVERGSTVRIYLWGESQ